MCDAEAAEGRPRSRGTNCSDGDARDDACTCESWGKASKNGERASFVLFKPCEHWKSEGRENLPSGATGSIRPVREKKTIAGHFAVSGYSNNQSSGPKRVATNRF